MKSAVVGLGIGMAHVAGYWNNPRAELVAVCDAWEPRLTHVGGTFNQGSMHVLKPLFDPAVLPKRWPDVGCRTYSDIAQVAADPEVQLVSLCTPDYLHEEHAVQLLEAGKHLNLEKPVALTVAGAERVAAAAAANNRRLAIGYEFRVNPAVRRLRQLVADGALGEVAAFSLYHYRTPFRRNKWNHWIQKKEYSGGLLIEETCHWFDLARFVTGKEVATVSAEATDRIHPDFDYEDVAYVQGRYTDGGVYQISHALTGFDFSLVLQVHGTGGTAWCGLKEERYSSLDGGATSYLGIVSWAPLNALPTDAEVTTYDVEATEPFNIRDLTGATVDAFASGTPAAAEYADGLRSLKIALAARDSLETKKTIEMV